MTYAVQTRLYKDGEFKVFIKDLDLTGAARVANFMQLGAVNKSDVRVVDENGEIIPTI